jgi:hypothetical protein
MSRQLKLEQLRPRRSVSIGLIKRAPDTWIVVKPKTTPNCLAIRLDESIYLSTRAHVFRLAINEKYAQIQCDLKATFIKQKSALEYLYHGKIKCSPPCRHTDRECKQRCVPVKNNSELWEYAYFVIYHKKLTFRPYTDIGGIKHCNVAT